MSLPPNTLNWKKKKFLSQIDKKKKEFRIPDH